jgi:hypothetical protein
MGWLLWRSHRTKAVMMTAEPVSAAMIKGDVHERPGASMIPHSKSPRPMIDRSEPTGSARLADGFLEFGTTSAAATRPTTAMGTLIRKTDPHQKWTSRKPPRIGPIATPSPAVPDHMPMARARSRSVSKTLVRIDSVHGIRAAAPTPMTARAIVRRSGAPDQAASADPAPNTSSPAMNTHLRPTRSPSAPKLSSRPANTMA